MDYSSPIEDDLSLSGKYEGQGTFSIANMQRLKVYVQDEHRLLQEYQSAHNAREYTEEHGSWIKTTAQTHPKIIAIGECGYDFFYNHSDAKEQEIAFTKQLEIAVETGLPVVIHTRNAEKETRKTLEPFLSQGITGVFHCYTSSQELAEFALEAGFYLSFNGIVTFPKSDNVRELLSMTPINRLLLETDAPFLTPVPYRGKKNFPGYLSLVGKYIAEYLTIDESKLAQQVSDNTKTLFHRYPH